MKKKIIAIVLAISALTGTVAFAAPVAAPDASRAVLMCYDETGKLVYSTLYKSENGPVIDIPEQFKDTKKKIYIADTKELRDFEATPAATDKPEATAEPTDKPEATAKPTDKPEATAKPTSKPSGSKYPAIYEKALDAIYAPAVIKEVEQDVNAADEEVYVLTVLYQGKEVKVDVETDLNISTAPEAYSYMAGESALALREGDVVTMTANVSGSRIKRMDFIFRPTEEDIVTGDTDYGESFEKLFSSGGSVAEQWKAMKYGQSASSDRYQYAFGIIGKKSDNVLTLINMDADIDKAIEVDMQPDTVVYKCDVDAKTLEPELSSKGDIETTLSAKLLDKGELVLNEDYSYNYALVRIVDKTATDIVVYENYNN